jgi:excisionase family DNA binding protein
MEQIAQNDQSTPPLLVTIPEAARLLAIGRSTLYELIAAGQLATVRVRRCARISVDELQEFVAESTDTPVGETSRRRHKSGEEATGS